VLFLHPDCVSVTLKRAGLDVRHEFFSSEFDDNAKSVLDDHWTGLFPAGVVSHFP